MTNRADSPNSGCSLSSRQSRKREESLRSLLNSHPGRPSKRGVQPVFLTDRDGTSRCVRCVSRLPSPKSVLSNRRLPLTALEPRAPGARRLELVRTFLVGSRSPYPTLPPTDHRPISDRGAVDRLDLGRGLPLWGVRPRRAGLCPVTVLNRRFRAEAGACSLTRPAKPHPASCRASPSLLGGEL